MQKGNTLVQKGNKIVQIRRKYLKRHRISILRHKILINGTGLFGIQLSTWVAIVLMCVLLMCAKLCLPVRASQPVD
jgi:hypothetical protein